MRKAWIGAAATATLTTVIVTGLAVAEERLSQAQTQSDQGTKAAAQGDTHISKVRAARIADILMSTASPAQTSVDAKVDVGEPLQGDLELRALPPAIVGLVPEYRGYEYVIAHDKIVIVQPSTRKVVEVIQQTEVQRPNGPAPRS